MRPQWGGPAFSGSRPTRWFAHERKISGMEPLLQKLHTRLDALPVPLALQLPSGKRLGPPDAAVRLEFADWAGLATLAAGQIGQIAEDYVEQRLRIHGRMRDVMAAAVGLLPGSPVASDTAWWTHAWRRAKSLA